MSDTNTLRVLALNGGGMRGYLSLVFLQRFLNQWGMVGTLADNFDVICGTSIGGISALGFGLGKSVDDLLPFFTEQGEWIFTIRTAGDVLNGSIDSSEPSNRPNSVQMALILGDNDQFYNSVDLNSNYGSSRLNSVLSGIFGNNTMVNMQTNILVTGCSTNTSAPVLFSNVNLTGYTGASTLVRNVARATSAAPLYLPPFTFDGVTYVDGGLSANNCSSYGLTLAKRIKPTAKRVCLLNLGTGVPPPHQWSISYSGIPFTGTAATLPEIIGVSLSTPNFLMENDLFFRSNYTLEDLFYYNFAPVLDPDTQDISLDNSDPSFIDYMYQTANTWYDNDIANITNFIGHLTA